MREILFRGKRIDSGEWVTGTPFFAANCCKMIQAVAVHPDFVDEGNVYYSEGFPVNPETVGQFTGLTDKNGKKIFEGDICTYPDGWVDYAGDGVETFSVGVVAWDEKNPSFYLTNNIGVEWDEIWDAVDEISVIGNIHDNPELLEGGRQ